MPIISGGGGGGNTTAQVAASGKVLPVASPTGVVVDTTTYDNTVTGSGKLTTLVYPAATNTGLLAVALLGDLYPRWLFLSDPTDGVYLYDGTADAYNSGAYVGVAASGDLKLGAQKAGGVVNAGRPVQLGRATLQNQAPTMDQVSPRFTITQDALPTLTITSGAGRTINATRDAETITPFTGDGTNNAATCAIALSPDNLTYSALATISIAAALNLTGVLTDTVNVRVPAGWYVKLTATHGTLGTTTYY